MIVSPKFIDVNLLIKLKSVKKVLYIYDLKKKLCLLHTSHCITYFHVTHLNLATALGGRWSYSHFIDKETRFCETVVCSNIKHVQRQDNSNLLLL